MTIGFPNGSGMLASTPSLITLRPRDPYGPGTLINHGIPYIVVEDGDFEGRRELYLKHYHDGRDLDMQYAEKTLPYVHQLWGRRVHLETRIEGKNAVLVCDGANVTKKVH